MTDAKKTAMEMEEEIKKLANEYCVIWSNGNKISSDKKKIELWTTMATYNMEYQNALQRKIISYIKKQLSSKDENKVDMTSRLNDISFQSEDMFSNAMLIFPQVLLKYAQKYKNNGCVFKEKNNFMSYFLGAVCNDFKNKLKKTRTADKKVCKTKIITDKNGNEKEVAIPMKTEDLLIDKPLGNGDNEYTFGESLIGKGIVNPEENAYSNDSADRMRQQLIYTVVRFFETKKGKAANRVRLSYYKIFVTEIVIKDIKSNVFSNIYNKQETMMAIDKGFVDFALRFNEAAFFERLEDIRAVPIKHYCDIFENGKDEELKLDHEAKPIIEYRFIAGMDKKRVTPSNVTQQKDEFEKDITIGLISAQLIIPQEKKSPTQ